MFLALPLFFYMNVSNGLRASVAGCPICFNYYIFTVYKCAYVHISHGNAFSYNMNCLFSCHLSVSVCGGDVFMSDLKD